MPPKVRYTPERILDAALRCVQESGIDALSARTVAATLGCSTAPVFTHFETMEALQEATLDRIMEDFVASAVAAEHEDPLMATGLAWIAFAAEEPRLYEAVFLRRHPWHIKWGPIRRRLAERMGAHPRWSAADESFRFALVGRASVGLHGLGLEIWSGRLQADDPERLLRELVLPLAEHALAQGWQDDLHTRGRGLAPQRDSASDRSDTPDEPIPATQAPASIDGDMLDGAAAAPLDPVPTNTDAPTGALPHDAPIDTDTPDEPIPATQAPASTDGDMLDGAAAAPLDPVPTNTGAPPHDAPSDTDTPDTPDTPDDRPPHDAPSDTDTPDTPDDLSDTPQGALPFL